VGGRVRGLPVAPPLRLVDRGRWRGEGRAGTIARVSPFSAQEQALAVVGRAASSRSPRAEVAGEIATCLRGVVDHAALEISLADPFTGEHRMIVNEGYAARVLAFIDSDFTTDDPGYRETVAGRRPTRMRDISFDYTETYAYQEIWRPAGYAEGITAPLITEDDRYVGMLNLSVEREEELPDQARDFLGLLAPLLAGAFDPLADLAGWLQDDDVARRLVVDADGKVLDCPEAEGEPSPRVRRSTVVGIATRMLQADQPVRRGLIPDHEGRLVSVHLARAQSRRLSDRPVVLASLREIEVPFGLTSRETEVLRHLIAGRSNREIADRLGVAPRTVATHIEHLLGKFDADTRTAVAGRALEQGLVRLDLEVEESAAGAGPMPV